MRIAPFLTALGAILVLFLLVFQRDAMLQFAGYDPDTDNTTTAATTAEPVKSQASTGVEVVAVKSSSQEIDSTVVLRGRMEAARKVALLAETSGRVISDPIPAGTQVQKGDALCQIDIGTREAQLAQAKAGLAQAETEMKNANALAQQGYAADTRVIAARASVEAAKAALAAIENDISHTRVTAPFDAVLESETTAPGSLMTPGGLCATLVDLDPIRLVGYVSEADIGRVETGALIGARLADGREVRGMVSFLSRSADPQTHTFRVEAEIANPDLSIRDGQSAEILIQSRGQQAHLLPQSTLTLNDDGTLGVRIAVAEDGEDIARFVPVDMLRDSPEGVWLAGLPDTARVIVEGQDYVTDGTALSVVMREPGS